MPRKTAKGADILRCIHSDWSEGWYWDDVAPWVHDAYNEDTKEYELDPNKDYDLEHFGVVVKGDCNDYIGFDEFLDDFLRKKDMATVVVCVPKAKEEELRALLRAHGYEV